MKQSLRLRFMIHKCSSSSYYYYYIAILTFLSMFIATNHLLVMCTTEALTNQQKHSIIC